MKRERHSNEKTLVAGEKSNDVSPFPVRENLFSFYFDLHGGIWNNRHLKEGSIVAGVAFCTTISCERGFRKNLMVWLCAFMYQVTQTHTQTHIRDQDFYILGFMTIYIFTERHPVRIKVELRKKKLFILSRTRILFSEPGRPAYYTHIELEYMQY